MCIDKISHICTGSLVILLSSGDVLDVLPQHWLSRNYLSQFCPPRKNLKLQIKSLKANFMRHILIQFDVEGILKQNISPQPLFKTFQKLKGSLMIVFCLGVKRVSSSLFLNILFFSLFLNIDDKQEITTWAQKQGSMCQHLWSTKIRPGTIVALTLQLISNLSSLFTTT